MGSIERHYRKMGKRINKSKKSLLDKIKNILGGDKK
jgi:hypothetical protein